MCQYEGLLHVALIWVQSFTSNNQSSSGNNRCRHNSNLFKVGATESGTSSARCPTELCTCSWPVWGGGNVPFCWYSYNTSASLTPGVRMVGPMANLTQSPHLPPNVLPPCVRTRTWADGNTAPATQRTGSVIRFLYFGNIGAAYGSPFHFLFLNHIYSLRHVRVLIHRH